jgi:hypothetical protein
MADVLKLVATQVACCFANTIIYALDVSQKQNYIFVLNRQKLLQNVSYNCLYAKLALARAFGVGGLRLLNAVPFAGVGSDGRRHVGRAERGLRRLKLGHILLDQRLQSGAYGPFGRQLR